MKLIDISPTISPRIAVWPGDVRFTREVCVDTDSGDYMTLSSINSTVHLGAHADAPNHYCPQSPGIGERALERYYGPCQVVRVELPRGERIRPVHLSEAITSSRVLFHTGSFPDPESWNSDFNALSAEMVAMLASQGVQLVGIDTPSIDLQEDKQLESHQAVAAHDMAILEGLILEQVPPGNYTLCALPLKIEAADASPVRAILISQ
ncbi:MAG: cyclase family protein [Planctomycetota bacterium]|jgi:arylformamidase|nr:cyclase family protein [Planctomycetota bacterium]